MPASVTARSGPLTALTDRFNREVNYLRLSVTDRCDFRCVYCMAEDMTFLPRREVLTLEELFAVARAFVALGVRKIRLTGGEPLIRRDILWLARKIAALPDLNELAITTNGSQLEQMAVPLREAGVRRINISLDSLRSDRFTELTRSGDLATVIRGIDAAVGAGFQGIKINAVILRGRNDDEVIDLVHFARDRAIDIAFIEEMPLGEIQEHDRKLSFVSSDELRSIIEPHFSLQPIDETTGGPARYYRNADHPSRIGFISPHSHNFCHLCNRVRVTVEGRLLLCLGNEHAVDLRAVLRSGEHDCDTALQKAIREAMNLKPEKHHFDLDDSPQILRFMNATGG